jgi:DNA-directed RNA polymerase specialized sigma24 family protein
VEVVTRHGPDREIPGVCAMEISDRPGISTNAVYQQLQRVKRELPVFISKQEPFE